MSNTINITVGAKNFVPEYAPVIELNHSTMYHLEGKNYQENGVLCYHHHTGNVADRRLLIPTKSQTINNNTPIGTYNITYSITNEKGTTTATRIIIVVKSPTITRLGDKSIIRYVGEPLNDPGYIIDNKGVFIEPQVIKLGGPQIDDYGNISSLPGVYTLTYSLSYGTKFPTFITKNSDPLTITVKTKKPTITVNPTIVYWKEGVIYNDQDAGNPITTNARSVTTNPSDLTTISSTQKIIYTAENSEGEKVTATREVRFIKEPTLVLKGYTTMNVTTGDVWVDPGYTAKDAFGITSYDVSITGVPVLDLENRMTTPGQYTLTYTLQTKNTPSKQVNSELIRTRTVNVVNPVNQPKLYVTPKRVYHRKGDNYVDIGVEAKTYDNFDITETIDIISIIRKNDELSISKRDIETVGNEIGEYIITYQVTHSSVTVKEMRYVDVYSDLLDDRNFISGQVSVRSTALVTILSHPTVSSIQVHTLPGKSADQKIIIDKNKAPCDVLKPFTFMTWVKVKGGQKTGTIILLQTQYIRIELEIKDNTADYFDGRILSTQIKGSVYGPIWSDIYLKELRPLASFSVEYPYLFKDYGRNSTTTMHDCPRLDEWLWFSLQYDGDKTFIMSINGTRFEHVISYYKESIQGASTEIRVAYSYPALQFDICNTCFIYRFLHIHEIQALYEYFVLNNTDLCAKYNAFDTQLNIVNTYIDKFKAGNNNTTDDTNFESALRNIRIIGHCAFQKEDGSHLQKALDIIKKFETDHGPLFVGPNNTYWDTKIGSLYQLTTDYYGFSPYQHTAAQTSQLNTHRLARGMLFFHHIVWDAGLQATLPYRHYFVSSEYPISFASGLRTKNLQDIAEKAKWGVATYIKGQTANVTASAEELSIILKIRNRKVKGIPGDYFSVPQIRCTGMWVNNGTSSEVTVPESMINKGIQICVGANMNDPSLVEGGHGGGTHGRMDRCATFFLIDRSTIRVYNPLGGNIYVLVPYGTNIGMVKLTATNVVRSRMFRMINDDITGFSHTTTKTEWDTALPMVNVTNSKVAVSPAGPPTVDIETDYMLLHIPSHWIEENIHKYNWLTEYVSAAFPATWTIYDRIKDLAMKYDSICKKVMQFRGMIGELDVVGAIDHPMFYTSVDMVMRTSAGGVGWPMVNSPLIQDRFVNKQVMNWCIDAATSWHELGHMYCNRALAFSNEGETSNEFLAVCLLNQACGIDLDSAYRFEIAGDNSMGLDDSVIDWMKEDLFLNGNNMTYYFAGYQKRSWHKYADIVALVGWDGFYAYQRLGNEAFERNLLLTPPNPLETVFTKFDTNRIINMTIALGIDIAPLMEFWGITDAVSSNQTAFRTNVRTIIERDLMGKKSQYFNAYGPPDNQQNCVVHKCRGVRTLLLYFKSLIPKTNKAMMEYVWKSWKQAFPVSRNKTLTILNITVVHNGSYNVYAVNGINNPVLNFVRGSQINFIQSDATNTNHQIAIKDSNGNSYTTGVVSTGKPGTGEAITVFKVPNDSPSDLRYYCKVDGNAMGNTMKLIINPETAETLTMTGANPTNKYLGWWEKFFITDSKKWNDANISAIENRIDQILADHGLTSEPVTVSGCIACANNKPNFNPTPKMDPCWYIMPTKSRINTIPYSTLTFYITEDALGFIVKGERDHNGPLAAGNMPELNVRVCAQLLFYVSTITPFYIMNHYGIELDSWNGVKNQGTTNGLLIWNNRDMATDGFYGKFKGQYNTTVDTYMNKVKRVFGTN